jgi:DNA-binding MltR family transcriptional regulator
MVQSWILGLLVAIRNAVDGIRNVDADISQRLNRETLATLDWLGPSLQDHLTLEDWKSLAEEVGEQTQKKNDRGVAIICASMVEDRLRWLIEAKFIEGLSETKRTWIFTGAGPLQSFAAKVEIALALGLIEEPLRAELRQIGKIRNKFAHNFRRVRFSDPELSNLCDELKKFPGASIQHSDGPMELYGRSCFLCMIALFVAGQLVLAARSTRPARSPTKTE